MFQSDTFVYKVGFDIDRVFLVQSTGLSQFLVRVESCRSAVDDV
jgi:hypothetical protein